MLRGLASHPERLLVRMIRWLVISARGHYTQAGATVDESVRGLTCINELMHQVANQLSSMDSREQRPDVAFIEALRVLAEQRGCTDDLDGAVARALEDTDRG